MGAASVNSVHVVLRERTIGEAEVEEWRDNFDDYQTTKDDGYDAYRDQPVEKDARETGGAYLDDLDGDDLDRIREEAR